MEEEVLFLKGQGRMLNKLSPVKIVKNLDWSLAHQAAMWQVCIICTGIQPPTKNVRDKCIELSFLRIYFPSHIGLSRLIWGICCRTGFLLNNRHQKL